MKTLTNAEINAILAKIENVEIGFNCVVHGEVPADRLEGSCGCPWCGRECTRFGPDYCNNASDIQRITWRLKDQCKFVSTLAKVIAGYPDSTRAGGTKVSVPTFVLLHAGPRAWCEAALRTLDAWPGGVMVDFALVEQRLNPTIDLATKSSQISDFQEQVESLNSVVKELNNRLIERTSGMLAGQSKLKLSLDRVGSLLRKVLRWANDEKISDSEFRKNVLEQIQGPV